MPESTKRKLAAKIGGLSLHLKRDSSEIAANARAGLEARFEREALEQDPGLSGAALANRVKLIKKLYFTRLALKRVKARGRR